MNNDKGKGKQKGKALWDDRATEVLINECLDRVCARQRVGSTFPKKVWDGIIDSFNAKMRTSYDKKQIKNRYDNLKRQWNTWDTLFSKETGIGFDSATNMIVADDEWWERKIQENPDYERYRYRGLKFFRELGTLFKDVVASGADQFAPSASQPPTQVYEEDDAYRPAMNVDEDDLTEGSGDSEDDSFGAPSAGVSTDLEGLHLRSNSDYSAPSARTGSGSSGKRKRGEFCAGSRKKKAPASHKIADALSRIATNTEPPAESMRLMNEQERRRQKIPTAVELAAELHRIPEIKNDRDLLYRCSLLLDSSTFRGMFVSFTDREELVGWLRFCAYAPTAFGITLPPPP